MIRIEDIKKGATLKEILKDAYKDIDLTIKDIESLENILINRLSK